MMSEEEMMWVAFPSASLGENANRIQSVDSVIQQKAKMTLTTNTMAVTRFRTRDLPCKEESKGLASKETIVVDGEAVYPRRIKLLLLSLFSYNNVEPIISEILSMILECTRG